MMCIRLWRDCKGRRIFRGCFCVLSDCRGRKTSREKICQSGKTFGGWFLFSGGKEGKWMCLNCGHIHSGKQVPEICPLCRHERGYFIPLSLAPYTGALTGSEMEE